MNKSGSNVPQMYLCLNIYYYMIRKIDRGLIEPFMFTPTRVIKVDVKHRFGGFDSKNRRLENIEGKKLQGQ